MRVRGAVLLALSTGMSACVADREAPETSEPDDLVVQSARLPRRERETAGSVVFEERSYANAALPAKARLGRAGGTASMIQGPLGFGEPIHERATMAALVLAGLAPPGSSWTYEPTWQFMRGVCWNDDPTGLLFKLDGSEYTWGVEWYADFQNAECEARDSHRRPPFALGDDLLARSHFGDMQCLHGMASDTDETPSATRTRMLEWAEFAYAVASGAVPENTAMTDIGAYDLQSRMADPRLGTVADLFCRHGPQCDVRRRAIGSLLHMIEDSYSRSHTVREDLGDGRLGGIHRFYCYLAQDPGEHKALDELPLGRDPIEACAEVLRMWSAGRPWPLVRDYLLAAPFALQ